MIMVEDGAETTSSGIILNPFCLHRGYAVGAESTFPGELKSFHNFLFVNQEY